MYEEEKLKAISISNFYPDRMVDIASLARARPMVNQVETHVLNQQTEAKKRRTGEGIIPASVP